MKGIVKRSARTAGQLGRSLRGFASGIEGRVLILSLFWLAALAAYRAYSYWTTGLFVADEFDHHGGRHA